MKRFKILSAVVAVILMVGAVSCTSMRDANDGYYYGNDRVQGANRIYVEDPYRGTVVLERDPYSGRYYEVSPYGYSTGYGSNRYGTVYNNNNTRYRTRTTSRTNRNAERYERQTTTPPRQTEDQKKDMDNKRAEARRKILGN